MSRRKIARFFFSLFMSAAVGASFGYYSEQLFKLEAGSILFFAALWALIGATIGATEEWIARCEYGPFRAAMQSAGWMLFVAAGVQALYWLAYRWNGDVRSSVVGGTVGLLGYLAICTLGCIRRFLAQDPILPQVAERDISRL